MVLGEELLQQQHSHVSSEAAAAGGGMMAANNRTRSEQHIPSIVLPLHTQVHTTLPSQPAVLCPLARTSQNNSASNLYGMGKPSASSPSLYGMGTGAPSPALHTITPLSPAAAAAAPQAGGGGGGGGGLDSLPLPFKSIASSNLIAERVLVVANRLPVTCSKKPDGTWQLQSSSGGLVSALKGVTNYEAIWIGWPGMWVKPGKEREVVTGLLKEQGYVPVWIDPTLLDLYYNGFCNTVLWQLFHYVPLNIDTWQKMAEHRAMQMQWQAYLVANNKFAEVVLEIYEANDVVWVQDYHLMQLPQLLKNAIPKMKVGFFLHTPFPSSEVYRTLPVREELLKAVLGADLIGFHTYDYARHFISSCTRILGLEGTPEGVENNGCVTRVATFPIGIDPERFTRALDTDEVQGNIAKLLNRYAGRKIMLGVDRLDMVKGIPQKLLAYEKFLEEHPEWRDKVLLVQIAVPSRTDVPEYQKLRSMVHEIVGRINGQFGTLTYVPIYHLDTSLSFTELCALYAVTDVALVTSLRDGMNLVSYEYVACQSDNAGVLVLSEFAGAAQSLGAGALLVNPWNISDVAQAIEDALTMSKEERRERHQQNYMHVQTHTAQNWADNFISELNDTHIEADLRLRQAPPPLDVPYVVSCYKQSRKRLIVLGYNATLTNTSLDSTPSVRGAAGVGGGVGGGGGPPTTPSPPGHSNSGLGGGSKRAVVGQYEQSKAMAKVNPKVIASIDELCKDPDNMVVIFSGSETVKLEEMFASLPVWLAAENGVYVRPPAHVHRRSMGLPGSHQEAGRVGGSWVALFDTINREWMEAVHTVLDYFCERTPRYADIEFGRIQARDLLQHLWTGPISNAPVEIIQGGRSVEVRPVGVTKGLALQRLLGFMAEVQGRDKTFDFVLCVGHLLTRDENMFSVMEGENIDGSHTNPNASTSTTNPPNPASGSNNNNNPASATKSPLPLSPYDKSILSGHMPNSQAATSHPPSSAHAVAQRAEGGGGGGALGKGGNSGLMSSHYGRALSSIIDEESGSGAEELNTRDTGGKGNQLRRSRGGHAAVQAKSPTKAPAKDTVEEEEEDNDEDTDEEEGLLGLPLGLLKLGGRTFAAPQVPPTSSSSSTSATAATAAAPTTQSAPNLHLDLPSSIATPPSSCHPPSAATATAPAPAPTIAIPLSPPSAAVAAATATRGLTPGHPSSNSFASTSSGLLPSPLANLNTAWAPSPASTIPTSSNHSATSPAPPPLPPPPLPSLGSQSVDPSKATPSADQKSDQDPAAATQAQAQTNLEGTNLVGGPSSRIQNMSLHHYLSASSSAPGVDAAKNVKRFSLDETETAGTNYKAAFLQMMRNRGSVGRPAFGSSSSPYNNTTSPSPSAMGGARTSSVVAKSGSSSLQLPPDAFPPKFLFTCTVGRNRSKARFSLAAASEVGDLLETLVQQCIYGLDPPPPPNSLTTPLSILSHNYSAPQLPNLNLKLREHAASAPKSTYARHPQSFSGSPSAAFATTATTTTFSSSSTPSYHKYGPWGPNMTYPIPTPTPIPASLHSPPPPPSPPLPPPHPPPSSSMGQLASFSSFPIHPSLLAAQMAVSMSSGISPGLSPHSRVGHDENPFGTGGGGFHSLQEAVEGEEEDGEVEEKEVGWKDGEGTEEEWSDSLSGTVSHHYEPAKGAAPGGMHHNSLNYSAHDKDDVISSSEMHAFQSENDKAQSNRSRVSGAGAGGGGSKESFDAPSRSQGSKIRSDRDGQHAAKPTVVEDWRTFLEASRADDNPSQSESGFSDATLPMRQSTGRGSGEGADLGGFL